MDENSEEEECGELNVQSEDFDPLQAIYSSKTKIPFPSAPVLDNIAKVSSLLSKNEELVNKPRVSQKEVESTSSANVTQEKDSTTGTTRLTKERKSKNVFMRMSEARGPLAFLRTCMEKRLRVKVWTRTARGLRGHCLGFVVAFDKHWNLILRDVHEVWTRRVKRKTFLLGKGKDQPIGWKAMGPPIQPPKTLVKRGPTKGTETCERHVNQMLMRGEQIAFVSVSDA